MIKPKLLVSNQWHKEDCKELGIVEENYKPLLSKLAELRDDLYNECTYAHSPDLMYNILSNTEISYRTDEAFEQGGNTIYVPDSEFFCQLCEYEHEDKSIEKAWLSVLYEIADDISTLEDRYGEIYNGKFLRSLLVYFSNFRITDTLR